ncbi:MAG: hypothetical protein JWO38_6047 [Gemmataceae bacterium]|nr:hypothetical protein [Gemmataceae bacterium]
MYRVLFGAIVAIALCAAPVEAQVPRGVTFGVGAPGGRMPGGSQPFGPSLSAPSGSMFRQPAFHGFQGGNGFRGGFRAGAFPSRSRFGGFYSGYPYYSSYYGGFGGGFITGGYSPLYMDPGPGAYDLPPPPQGQPFDPPGPLVEVSGEATATLSVQFPAPASVWLDGKELPGKAATDRRLTSPVLRPGEQYMFHIRARWETNGRTYETTKDVPLGPGDRSRLLVVSGTAVTDEK